MAHAMLQAQAATAAAAAGDRASYGGAAAMRTNAAVERQRLREDGRVRRARLLCAKLTPNSLIAVGKSSELRGGFRSRRAGVVRSSLNETPSTSGPAVYQGIYGPWSVEDTDVREVLLYRAGLVVSAGAFLTAASSAFLPDGFPLKSAIEGAYDPLYLLGASGLGLSLLLIHIYVTPIKRTLQLMWAVGALGSILLAVNFAGPADSGLVEFVLKNPAGVWAVGPLFVALTGLAFKEGLCYGKFEAGALVFVIPTLLLGHLSGGMDSNAKLGLLAIWIALFSLFASRKFTQPIKDDIGDKSVFVFQALPEDEKRNLMDRMMAEKGRVPDQN